MVATKKQKKAADSPQDSKYYYDESAANEAIQFISNHITLQRGKKGFTKFIPQAWEQERIIKPVFGWKRANGTRKYRTVFIMVPRKNNKSTLGNSMLLTCGYLDDEPG